MKSKTKRLLNKLDEKDLAMLEDNLLIRELLDKNKKLKDMLSEVKDVLTFYEDQKNFKENVTYTDHDAIGVSLAYFLVARKSIKKIEEILNGK